MSNLIVEGFGTYGVGVAMSAAMEAGAWAEVADSPFNPSLTLQQGVPWDSDNSDYWVFCDTSGPVEWAARRVTPTTLAVSRWSSHVALDRLPTANRECGLIQWRDSANFEIASLYINSTGAAEFVYTTTGASIVTTGPVVVAQKDHHFECSLTPGTGAFTLYVDGVNVLSGTGLAFSNAVGVSQFAICSGTSDNSKICYVTSLIVRDDQGTYNNTFPIGDRRVATLLPNSDVAGQQGWAARYLQRFGVGVLDISGSGDKGVSSALTVQTDIGANEFTFEGQFRFQTLPASAGKATLFGKWDGDANARSYELYLGGPNLDNGLLVFRTSTDGNPSTVVDKAKWAWQPAIGHWYHIAMQRRAGNLELYIDGVRKGAPVADADTYFAANARAAIGCEMSGSSPEPSTGLDGWVDEFRLTTGTARYSANFVPPTAAFPRNASDPDWGSVKWLSSWDNATIVDDGPLALALTGEGSAAAVTPGDAAHAYQVLNKPTPDDDTFLEAALIPATGIFTMTALPTAAETVTVGTKDGTAAAVYTFRTALAAAYDVLIGADVAATAANLAAAINKGTGEGVTFGTGTLANADVSAAVLPSNQVEVTALTPGTVGNAIASTETGANASWGAATLAGGIDIPPASQFGLSRMPPNTVTVDSITLVARQWKSDSGSGSTRLSFVGGESGVAAGDTNVLGTTPNLTFDTIEQDPDTLSGLTTASILLGKVKIDRVA